MWARYKPAYGVRFLSPDPADDIHLGDPQSWNKYAYVRGRPLFATDPFGLSSKEDCADDDADGTPDDPECGGGNPEPVVDAVECTLLGGSFYAPDGSCRGTTIDGKEFVITADGRVTVSESVEARSGLPPISPQRIPVGTFATSFGGFDLSRGSGGGGITVVGASRIPRGCKLSDAPAGILVNSEAARLDFGERVFQKTVGGLMLGAFGGAASGVVGGVLFGGSSLLATAGAGLQIGSGFGLVGGAAWPLLNDRMQEGDILHKEVGPVKAWVTTNGSVMGAPSYTRINVYRCISGRWWVVYTNMQKD